jgi:malonyl CoA-acyl carrier protein transacylase
MSLSAHIFTGQGFDSSKVRDYARSRHHTAVASRFEAVFGRRLPRRDELSEADVRRNEISAAILCISGLDKIDAAREATDTPTLAAGFSVGQYLAIHYAGCLSRDDLIGLLFTRCNLMNEAARRRKASLVAVLGLPLAKIVAAIEENGIADKAALSSDNAVGNYTFAVSLELIDDFIAICTRTGAYRAVRLDTTGGWHSDFVADARPEFERVLATTEFSAPGIRLVDNTHVSEQRLDPSCIRQTLAEHLVRPVRWRETIAYLAGQGVQQVHELTDFDLLSRMGAFASRKMQFVSLGPT